MARLRQAVIAARDLDATVARLRSKLELGDPYHDPAVEYFGLRNAVFAIGDTFLEVVAPIAPDAPAARHLDRRQADVCGYMAMIQVDDLEAARGRAQQAGAREVFKVEFEDIREVHLHPGDLGGAIVSLSEPDPAESWRWGGPDWSRRATAAGLTGLTVAVADPEATAASWQQVAGGALEVTFVADSSSPGIVEISVGARSVSVPALSRPGLS